MDTTKLKKELQRVIKEFRDSHHYTDYPKAMMTGAQERKGQATINCGKSYNSVSTDRLAAEVLADKDFQLFLAWAGAKAKSEFNRPDNVWQIRITF